MSEYDGHDNYRADVDREVNSLRGPLDNFLGFGALIGAMPIAYRLMDAPSGMGRLIIGVFAGFIGLVVGCVLLGVMARQRLKVSNNLLVTEILATLIIMVGFGPMFMRAMSPKRPIATQQFVPPRPPASVNEDVEWRPEPGEARRVALEWMRSNHRLARVGEVPIFLRAVDDGYTVRVTNVSDRAHAIELARVRRDLAVKGGWMGCALGWKIAANESPVFGTLQIKPRQTLTYVTDEDCSVAFEAAELEFRVGDPNDAKRTDYAWWSESALAAPDGWR